jgi:TonB family protein
MFLAYFRLREQPFGVTPDPRYLFSCPGHEEALASLIYGIESNLGFGSLIAKSGMGKTTLLFHILERYRWYARTAFIFNTQCDSRDLLRSLLGEIDDQPVPDDTFQLHQRFKQILAGAVHARRRVLLVIDEAQNLDAAVMETIRLLSNFESPNCKALHIILAGQPELAAKLSRPELNQLQQRIPILAGLPCLSQSETIAYIEHRLRVAGNRGKAIFTPEALSEIARLCRGVPREINRLCFNCLSLAYAIQTPMVDSAVIAEVAVDLDLDRRLPKQPEIATQQAAMNGFRSPISRVASVPALPTQSSTAVGSLARKSINRATVLSTLEGASRTWRRLAAGVLAPRKPVKHQPPKGASVVPLSLSNTWPASRKPALFALAYLTVIAGGWASIGQWPAPKLSSASPKIESGDTRPLRHIVPNEGTKAPSNKRLGQLDAIDSLTRRTSASAGKRVAKLPLGVTCVQLTFDLPPGRSSGSIGRPPTLLKYVPPLYPPMALDQHIEGAVVLSAVVTRDGKVSSIKRTSGDPVLLEAAERAARNWVYRPFSINGQAVDLDATIVIQFSLPTKR